MFARVVIAIVTLLSMLLPHCHCVAADCCGAVVGCHDSARDCCQSDACESHEHGPLHQHSGPHCRCVLDHDLVSLPPHEFDVRSLVDLAPVGLLFSLPEADAALSSPLMERTRRDLVTRLECQKVLCRWTC